MQWWETLDIPSQTRHGLRPPPDTDDTSWHAAAHTLIGQPAPTARQLREIRVLAAARERLARGQAPLDNAVELTRYTTGLGRWRLDPANPVGDWFPTDAEDEGLPVHVWFDGTAIVSQTTVEGQPLLTYHEVEADDQLQARLQREAAAPTDAAARRPPGTVLARHTITSGNWFLTPEDFRNLSLRLPSATRRAGLPVRVLIEPITTPDGDRLAVTAQVDVDGQQTESYLEVPASAQLQARLQRESAALAGAAARLQAGRVITRRTTSEGYWFLDPTASNSPWLPSGTRQARVPVQVLIEPITPGGDRFAVIAQIDNDGEPVLAYSEVEIDAETQARLQREIEPGS
jgi:hypothetical protein